MPRDARAVVVHEEKLRQVVNVGQHMRAAAARGCEVAEGDGAMVCVYGGLRDRVHTEGRLTNAMCRQEALRRMDVTHSCNVRKSREIECVEDVHRGGGVHKQQKPWAHLGSNVQVCVKYKERFNNEKKPCHTQGTTTAADWQKLPAGHVAHITSEDAVQKATMY